MVRQPVAGASAAGSVSTGRPGLTSVEAALRLAAGEGNAAPLDTSRSYRRILLENFFTPINTILFAIGIILVVLGLGADAVMTAGLVLVNVLVGVFQEARAKRQLDAIALLARPKAKVIRDGAEREIDPDEIVRGDVLNLQPGDQVQVDGSVLEAENLSVDESLLTGESDLVRKEEGDSVFSGSFAMTGSGLYEAVQVGAGSMANQITARARSFRVVRTPLQREVAWVIWGMAVFVLLLGGPVVNSIYDIYGKLEIKETVRAAAVIVALVPQGLSFMVTATYAMAAVRIGQMGALVQRLNAVESISHIDVLCLDKTGTLTTNELGLEALAPFEIDEAELKRLLGAYAASASVSNRTNSAILQGSGGVPLPVAGEIGFDSARKWSALQFAEGGPEGVFVLGAPEMIEGALENRDVLYPQAGEWASEGLRVLLFARGEAPSGGLDAQRPQLPQGLQALGLVALRDELRADARETILSFSEGGIVLKIISGDNPQTVAALAKQAGFPPDVKLISGTELEGLSERELERVAEDTTIFGRIVPQHKEALVKALQRRGHYVAMTGDGVNDVPALKQAQVAIAVKSGSPVTRNVADIVLIDDSFAVLPSAFTEGQRIRKGMESIIRLFLVRTFAVSLVILGASLLSDPFPITPAPEWRAGPTHRRHTGAGPGGLVAAGKDRALSAARGHAFRAAGGGQHRRGLAVRVPLLPVRPTGAGQGPHGPYFAQHLLRHRLDPVRPGPAAAVGQAARPAHRHADYAACAGDAGHLLCDLSDRADSTVLRACAAARRWLCVHRGGARGLGSGGVAALARGLGPHGAAPARDRPVDLAA